MRTVRRQRFALSSARRRVGMALMMAGLVLALVPVTRYAHARIYYELVTRGIITLASDPALDLASRPPVPTTPPSGGAPTGLAPSCGPPGDPATGGTAAPGGTTPGSTSPGGTPTSGGAAAPTEPVWRIHIPKLNVTRALVFDVTPEVLKLGPGVYPQGAQPGEPGNLCIAGHRNTHGSPFWYLDRLVAGDEVRITYGNKVYVYRVERSFVVDPTDWSVVAPTGYDAITLTTCHPLGSTDRRLIVRGRLDRVL